MSSSITIVNFAHPLTDEHLAQIASLTGKEVEQIIDIPSQINLDKPIVPQVQDMIDRAGLSDDEWKSENVVANLPALSISAGLVVLALFNRYGVSPSFIRMSRVRDVIPPKFKVVDVIRPDVVVG